ncbi:MAG: hypothetical protein ACE1ZX_03075 [Acidimicrobiia bacterium]
MDPDREHDRRPRARLFATGLLLRGHRLKEHGLVAAIAGVFVLSACAGSATTTTQATELPATPTTELPATPTTEQVTTTPPVVTIDARFLLSTVVFGDQGWIEVINTGPQAGNIHGHWIAIHPFYLELPSTIVEVGQTVRVSLDPDADLGVVVGAAGLLPVLVAPSGEVGLYSSGNFGDPNSIVDYLEWGSGGHFRSTVAIAAGVWDENSVVPMEGSEGGLRVTEGGDAAAEPVEAAEVATPSDPG